MERCAYIDEQEPSGRLMDNPCLDERERFLRIVLEFLNALVSKFLGQGGVDAEVPQKHD